MQVIRTENPIESEAVHRLGLGGLAGLLEAKRCADAGPGAIRFIMIPIESEAVYRLGLGGLAGLLEANRCADAGPGADGQGEAEEGR